MISQDLLPYLSQLIHKKLVMALLSTKRVSIKESNELVR